jgi:hypothetical protein
MTFVNYASRVKDVWGQQTLHVQGVWCLSDWVMTASRRNPPGIPHPVHSAGRNACRSSCTVPVLMPDFKQNWNVTINFRKTHQYQISLLRSIFWTLSIVPMFFQPQRFGGPIEASSIDQTHQSRFT